MENLKERRETLFTKFTLKSLNVNQMQHLLQVKIKEHQMKTRNTEQYYINNTNTERFKKSAGIQMQYKLNEIV